MSDKARIMIVEDDPDLSELLQNFFTVQGYEVLSAAWGEEGVRLTREHSPDLVVLDIRLPDIDGYEVCRRIRTNRRTQDIPVIFLTEKRDRVDKLAGLELGVVDYITKPFDIQELRLRVRNVLRRAEQAPLTNRVTNLPEGSLVEEKVNGLLLSEQPWALLAVEVRGLDGFRETYGFVNADDVLRAVTLMINNALRESGSDGDFVGHLQENEFVILTDQTKSPTLQQRIETRIQQSMEYFYPMKDREKMHLPETKGHLRLIVTPLNSAEANLFDFAGLRAELDKRRTEQA
ncbi:response regulator [Chloroflexi bacterium CFX3]|nr:response regulator [Chloroflexi bacterium CFX3]